MAWALNNRLFFSAIFLSGFSALVYQLIWVRLLGLVFGVSSFAVATVVAVFLLGLGLGSYFFGRWSERTRNPLRIYMYVEAGIAIASLASYVVIDYLPVYRYLYEYSYNNLDFYGLSIIRLLLSVAVLLPPVFLIGGTMPLISKYFLTTSTTLGSGFSKIYYLNTLGAFAGALLTGFVLVRYLGVVATLMIAIAGNLLVAAIIATSKSNAEPIPEPTEERAPYSYMLVILFLTGFISLSYEVLWVRILSTYGLSTSQAFALIVAGFLLGFSIGSFLVSRRIDGRQNLERWFSRVCILTALSGALVLFLFRRFEALTDVLTKSLPLGSLTASLAMAFLVSLIPAIFMGILFPLGMRIYAHDAHRIGAKAGAALFSNTAGCVLGSLLTGFVLIPFVGLWNTTLILVNLGLLISLALFLRLRDSSYVHWGSLALAAVMANLLVFSDSKTFHKAMAGLDLVYYAEGLSGTVSVLGNDQYRGVFVDGQNVSGTDPVLVADSKMLAHLPLLMADDPQSAVTVGFGTGTTSGSMLLHDVAVHAVEIEEKIIEAAPLFSAVNRKSYADPALSLVMDDARNYIGVADQKFDVIVTDVTNLKYKRNPYLYTREYFEIMQAALTADGIAAEARLQVYRNNSRALFEQALRLTFPVVLRRVGDDYFRQLAHFHRAAHPSRSGDLHDVGRFWLDYSRRGIERGLQARAALPKSQIYDVRLRDLKENPLETIQRIYGHFDLPFDEPLAARLRERIAEEPTAQLGEHDYDIADYGLSRDQIEDAFVGYREAFGV